MDIGAYATALAEDRRVNPHDDLTTSLVQAEVDGERLTSAEVASFFILLVGGRQRDDPQCDQPRACSR